VVDSETRGEREPGQGTAQPAQASSASFADYALLEALFLGALALVAERARRAEFDGEQAIDWRELPVLALATFALADVVAHEKISTWLRRPFVVEGADHRPIRPSGRGLRYAVGELMTCTRCVGTWSALGLLGLRIFSPPVGRVAATVLALAGANDVAQSGFKLLTEKTNLERASEAGPAR
jgi:hypothetical protein